jgi:hypothetical protein
MWRRRLKPAPRYSLASLDDFTVAASVSAAKLGVGTIEFGDLTVICLLRRVQAQQPGRNALGAGGGDWSGGHQCNESYGSGECEGFLEKLRHGAFSFGLDAPRNAWADK